MNVERDVLQGKIEKNHKFLMISQLQWYGKMQGNTQFENLQMIRWQLKCNECGMNCRTRHNLKIRKWSDDESIAINVERDAGQCTIWKFTDDQMASHFRWMQKEEFWTLLKKMQNPLLCKDLQAIGALKKHLEKNHTLLSVVSFQSYDKNGILLAWILGEWVEFFLSYDKIVLCQRCHSRHCRRQCKIFARVV